MKKHFLRILRLVIILPLVISIPACSPHGDSMLLPNMNLEKEKFVGTWLVNNQIYCLDADGMLGLPTRTDVSGGFWDIRDNELVLSMLDAPANPPKEEIWKLRSVKTSRLYMQNSLGENITWIRDNKQTGHLEGELFYLEKIALPPEVTIRIDITQENGKKKLVSSLRTVPSSVPLPFRAHYLPSAVNKSIPFEVSAVIYYKENSIFATDEPVKIMPGENFTQPIRVYRSLLDDASPEPFKPPVAFAWNEKRDNIQYIVQLYLEPDNLFFLVQQSKENGKEYNSIEWGRWNQINRGHSLELLIPNEEPIIAGIRPSGDMVIDRLPEFDIAGAIQLKSIPISHNTLTREIAMSGTVKKEKNNTFSFMPCGSTTSYSLTGEAVNTIKKKMTNSDTLSVVIMAQYERPNSIHALSLVNDTALNICVNSTQSVPLTNTYWRLTTLNSNLVEATEHPELHLLLRPVSEKKTTSGEGGGSDGCNSFFLNWDTENEKINIDVRGTTLMMCQDGQEQSQAYIKSLDETETYFIQGSVLELKSKNGTVATFEAVAL